MYENNFSFGFVCSSTGSENKHLNRKVENFLIFGRCSAGSEEFGRGHTCRQVTRSGHKNKTFKIKLIKDIKTSIKTEKCLRTSELSVCRRRLHDDQDSSGSSCPTCPVTFRTQTDCRRSFRFVKGLDLSPKPDRLIQIFGSWKIHWRKREVSVRLLWWFPFISFSLRRTMVVGSIVGGFRRNIQSSNSLWLTARQDNVQDIRQDIGMTSCRLLCMTPGRTPCRTLGRMLGMTLGRTLVLVQKVENGKVAPEEPFGFEVG